MNRLYPISFNPSSSYLHPFIPVSCIGVSCKISCILYSESWNLYTISGILEDGDLVDYVGGSGPTDEPLTITWPHALSLGPSRVPLRKSLIFRPTPQTLQNHPRTSLGEVSSVYNRSKIHSWNASERTLLKNNRHWVQLAIYRVWTTSYRWNPQRFPLIIHEKPASEPTLIPYVTQHEQIWNYS